MKTFEEVYETLPGNGWLSKEEARLLYEVAEKTTGPILEVGCYEGRSTVLLASFDRPVYCVDPFDGFTLDRTGDEIETAWKKNMVSRGIRNTHLNRCRIEDLELKIPQTLTFGMAYLDGDHTYGGTVQQIQKAKELQDRASKRRSMIIAIHDVNDTGEGQEIKRAAEELLGSWMKRVERLAIWKL